MGTHYNPGALPWCHWRAFPNATRPYLSSVTHPASKATQPNAARSLSNVKKPLIKSRVWHLQRHRNTFVVVCCVVFLPRRSTVGRLTHSWWLAHFVWDASPSYPMCFSANEQLGGRVHNWHQGLSDFSYKGVEHKKKTVTSTPLKCGWKRYGWKSSSVPRMDLPGHLLLPPLSSLNPLCVMDRSSY